MAGAEVRIGGRLILGPLDLVIGAGERWVLLGPNGSGKTTALSLMGARRQPSAGTVEVLGERLGRIDVRRAPPTDRSRIAPCGRRAARRGLGPGHGAAPGGTRRSSRGGSGSTTTTWRAPTRCSPRSAATTLADRPLETCSLGERQRVLIARALFGEHELLLFDEPAAGLDLPARERLLAAMTGPRDRPPCSRRTTWRRSRRPRPTPRCCATAGWSPPARSTRWWSAQRLSACFGMPIVVERADGRWTARAGG